MNRPAFTYLAAICLSGCLGTGSQHKDVPRVVHHPRSTTSAQAAPATGDAAGAAPSAAYAAGPPPAPMAKAARPFGHAPSSSAAPRRADDGAAAPMRRERAPRITSVPHPHGPAPTVTPPPHRYIPRPAARLLTAASVGDVDRFGNYLNYLSRRRAEAASLGLQLNRRLRIRVLDAQGRPINDAKITTQTNRGSVIGRSHADGRWDFFPALSGAHGQATITVQAGQKWVRVNATLPRGAGTREFTIQLPSTRAQLPRAIDLAFAIDVTGSMGDELRYVNRELSDMVRRIRAAAPNTSVRVGAVFYRDRGDSQPLSMIQFTSDVHGFTVAMQRVQASGGGDYPEDMNAGLALAMRSLRWRRGNVARVMVLLADAPPKRYHNASYTYHHAISEASSRGIRLLPVAASGANRKVEYLFRAMAVATSTPYVYLTNDSGIGNAHMEADTDRVGVEKFNDLLTRMIIADLRGQGMHEPAQLGPQ